MYVPKWFPLQSGSRKLLPKVAAESCPPKLRSKANSQSCCFFQSFCSKLPRKAAPASQTCSTKLFPKGAPKIMIKSCSEYNCSEYSCSSKLLKLPLKLLPKAASQSCFLKVVPKNIVCCCKDAILFPTIIFQNCS